MKNVADSVKESMIGAKFMIPALSGTASVVNRPVPKDNKK